jgi:hypothetical protein
MSGLGNVGIHARLLECDLKNSFTKDDIILTVWSSWTREDRYDVATCRFGRPTWTASGDVFRMYDKNFIDNCRFIFENVEKGIKEDEFKKIVKSKLELELLDIQSASFQGWRGSISRLLSGYRPLKAFIFPAS